MPDLVQRLIDTGHALVGLALTDLDGAKFRLYAVFVGDREGAILMSNHHDLEVLGACASLVEDGILTHTRLERGFRERLRCSRLAPHCLRLHTSPYQWHGP